MPEDFYSDKSRIVFCSSFRRMMQKAQVFSLEANTSVRNRLTHSLEVADIGRTLARRVGNLLIAASKASHEESDCIQSIVENACLLHDIGNPPFGHFGEEAIKHWFKNEAPKVRDRVCNELPLEDAESAGLYDFTHFDGNPQGFRIATRLHAEIDLFGLNLTYSTLLASIKYPNCGRIPASGKFTKKLGAFSSERDVYELIHTDTGVSCSQRYWLSYLMELADDICYCLSDIADAFEKRITTSREFKEDFKKICKEEGVADSDIIPEEKIENFGYQVAIKVSQKILSEAAAYFVANLDAFLSGEADELSKTIESGRYLKCFKTYARRFIYTTQEAQRIELAGSRIVKGLLDHFGALLHMTRSDFMYFIEERQVKKDSGFDTEWRIFNQLSRRMLKIYEFQSRAAKGDFEEWICRARLIVDYISGLTDNSALELYQNVMGIKI